MTIAIVILGILCVILITTLSYVGYQWYRLALVILKLEEEIEESLDILDGMFNEMAQLLEVPVVYDDPIVRQVVDVMKRLKQTILVIANKITSVTRSEEDEDDN